jgi:hypothetical protein
MNGELAEEQRTALETAAKHASVEKSVSASEELNAQAEQPKVFVAELVSIVGGIGNGR